jgi:hypothetical protein
MKKTLAIIIAAAVLALPVFASIMREIRIHPRTDRHNNPTAMIWTPGVEAFFSSLGYRVKKGEPFPDTDRYHTLDMSEISDPVGATVQYIDAYGFYAPDGRQRWDHTAMSAAAWGKLTVKEKRAVIQAMYNQENGTRNSVFASAKIEDSKPVEKKKEPLPLLARIEPPIVRPAEAPLNDRPLPIEADEEQSPSPQYRHFKGPEPPKPAITATTILERTFTDADADEHGNIRVFRWDDRFQIGDEIRIIAATPGNSGQGDEEIYIYRGPDRIPAWKKTANGYYQGTIERVPAGKAYYVWLEKGKKIEAKIVVIRRITG